MRSAGGNERPGGGGGGGGASSEAAEVARCMHPCELEAVLELVAVELLALDVEDLLLELVPAFATQLGGGAKVLANAHAAGDVDGDDATELLFGSVAGDLAIYKLKGDRLVKWRSCCVDGSVTAICVDAAAASDARVFVATAEGSCFVVTESGDEIRVSSEFRVALNVCDLAVLDGDLVVATQDGGLFIYSADANALGGYKQLEKFEIKREIEAFQLLAPSAANSRSNSSSSDDGSSADGGGSSSSSRLVVRCTSGEFFHVATLSEQQKKRTVQTWRVPATPPTAPDAGGDDQAAFIVDGVRGSSSGAGAQIAVASLSGDLSVFSAAHELQWSAKVPEAVVALDKLAIASSSTGAVHDVLVACTWSGGVYVVESASSIVRFRMLYPATQMFCADVYESVDKCERVLVGISTSGVIFLFRHVEDTLAHALAAEPLIDAIRQSELFAQLDNEERRREIAIKFLREASPLVVDLLSPAGNEVTIEDIVRLAVSPSSV